MVVLRVLGEERVSLRIEGRVYIILSSKDRLRVVTLSEMSS